MARKNEAKLALKNHQMSAREKEAKIARKQSLKPAREKKKREGPKLNKQCRKVIAAPSVIHNSPSAGFVLFKTQELADNEDEATHLSRNYTAEERMQHAECNWVAVLYKDGHHKESFDEGMTLLQMPRLNLGSKAHLLHLMSRLAVPRDAKIFLDEAYDILVFRRSNHSPAETLFQDNLALQQDLLRDRRVKFAPPDQGEILMVSDDQEAQDTQNSMVPMETEQSHVLEGEDCRSDFGVHAITAQTSALAFH